MVAMAMATMMMMEMAIRECHRTTSIYRNVAIGNPHQIETLAKRSTYVKQVACNKHSHLHISYTHKHIECGMQWFQSQIASYFYDGIDLHIRETWLVPFVPFGSLLSNTKSDRRAEIAQERHNKASHKRKIRIFAVVIVSTFMFSLLLHAKHTVYTVHTMQCSFVEYMAPKPTIIPLNWTIDYMTGKKPKQRNEVERGRGS